MEINNQDVQFSPDKKCFVITGLLHFSFEGDISQKQLDLAGFIVRKSVVLTA